MRTNFLENANSHPNRRGPPLRRLGPRVELSGSPLDARILGVNSCTGQDLMVADTALRCRLEAVNEPNYGTECLPYFCIYMADQTTWLEPGSGGIEQIGPYEIAIIDSELALHSVSTAGTRHLSIFLPRASVLARLPWIDDVCGRDLRMSTSARALARSLCAAFRASVGMDNFDAVAPGLVQSLLAMFSSLNEVAARPKGEGGAIIRQEQVAEQIQRRFADPSLTVAEIARELKVSARYLQRVCRDGESPGEQLRKFRLRQAAARLRSGTWNDRSISDICYSCGFSSSSHFSTEFRRFYGVTPRQYRI